MVKLNLKILATIIIVILLVSSIYTIFFILDINADNEAPIIDTITGHAVGNKGGKITIIAAFSDNINVTKATLYYKTVSATEWSSKSILSGSVDIPLNSEENLFYYITVDDEAGNGPVGNPSIDGSNFYMITVLKNGDNGGEYSHKVFVEEGSFTNCLYCPLVAKMLYELYTSDNYDFYYVTLVRTNEKAADRLDNEYNLYGLPTVYVDGGYKVFMGGTYKKSEYAQAIQEAKNRNVPEIQLSVTAEYDNNTQTLTSNVFVTNKEDETYDGRLRVYLTEKISRWSGPGGEPYHFGFHDYILNQEISVDANKNVSFEDIKDISDLDPENLMVIAVVFNSEKKQGYSDPANNRNPFDAYYADAADGAELVEGGNLPPSVGFSLPELRKLHMLGRPLFESIFHKNTVIIGKTKIVANAEDDTGIEKVEFYINGILAGEDTEKPYEYSFNKVESSKRLIQKLTLSVIAYDAEGKNASSSIEVIGVML
jgi:hypothetical protein